jgi:hypothetical protein
MSALRQGSDGETFVSDLHEFHIDRNPSASATQAQPGYSPSIAPYA